MKKVTVALIDSGVQTNVFSCCDHISGEYYCNSDHVVKKIDLDYNVSGLHGTICAAILQKYNPDVELISLQVAKDGYLASSIDVVEALKFCSTIHVNVISMSLGSTELRSMIFMYRYVEMLKDANVFIVSPIGKFGKTAFPGNYLGVLGVGEYTGTSKANIVTVKYSKYYNKEVIYARGSQTLISKDGHIYTTPNYSSFAVPVVTAIVAKLVSEYEKLDYKTIIERLDNYVCGE